MCLVSWPAQIKADPTPRQQYVHAVDVVPTIYDLLGIEPPEVIKGYVQSPIEGESFAKALTDANVPGRETQFYTMLGQRSIYHQGWLACTVHPPLAGLGRVREGRVGAVPPRDGPRADQERRGRRPRTARVAEAAVVLLRGHLQRPAARRPFRARAGPRGAATRRGGSSTLRVLPRLCRRPRIGGRFDQRPFVHDRRRRRARLRRRRRRALRARRRRRRPLPLRQGQATQVRLQLGRHPPANHRGRSRHHRGPTRPRRRLRRAGPEHRPETARLRRHRDALHRQRTRRAPATSSPSPATSASSATASASDATAPHPSRPTTPTAAPSRSPAAPSTKSSSTSPATSTSTTKHKYAPGS